MTGRKVTPENSFAGKHPDKVHLWHPSKNGSSKPTEFASQSNKRVWWRCSKGHDWEQKVSHISSGTGCPYCSGKKVTQENSFAGKHPDKVHLWHPQKNKTKTPWDFTHGSDKRVWWICQRGHEWTARIAMISKGSSCPTCNNEKQSKRQIERGIRGKGNALEKFPELNSEWHTKKNTPLVLSDFGVGSAVKVWWICKRGHEWKTAIRERCKGSSCPYCFPHISKFELRILSELEVVFDEVISQFEIDAYKVDILLPDEKIAIEVDGYPWHLNTASRDTLKSSRIYAAGFDLLRLRDARLEQLSPNEIRFKDKDSTLSIIKKTIKFVRDNYPLNEHTNVKIESYLTAGDYLNQENYTRRLSNIFVTNDEQSLLKFPHLINEWHTEKNSPLSPENFSIGSNQKVWWICSYKHEWQATIVSRTGRGTGCEKCSRITRGEKYRQNSVKKNGSLLDNFPNIADDWHVSKNQPLTPSQVSAGSSEKVWWQCSSGHEWQAIVRSRTKGTGCPICYRKRRSKKLRT